MEHRLLVQHYLAGPVLLRQSLQGLTAAEYDAHPVPGTWSIRQVICHLADAEIIYADRLKRIIVEDEPAMTVAVPERYLSALAIDERELGDELDLIASVRLHVGRILGALPPEQYQRRGIHSVDGPLTLFQVLERITGHIPHHLEFIQAKRQAFRAQAARQ